MSFREDVFGDLQNDACCPLLADEYFADIHVFDYRKEGIASLVEQALGGYTAKAGKLGVAVVALPLAINDENREGDSKHPRRVILSYRVLENPMFNNGSAGTRKSALSVCSRIGHVLKHYILGGFATGMVPDDPWIVPIDDPDQNVPVAYEVRFVFLENVDQDYFKVEMPMFLYDNVTGQLEILTATPDATIYYTLDGGYPHPTNPNGFTINTYTGPLTMEGQWFIRAAAFKENYLPSNVNALRAMELADQLGGGLGQEVSGGFGL